MLKVCRKIFFVFVIGIFLYDGIHDMASTHEPAGQEAACHTCVCGTHFAPAVPVMAAVQSQTQAYFVAEKTVSPYYASTFIFRPPKALA